MKKIAAGLFDLDGVILDTETQYTIFWEERGKLVPAGMTDFGKLVKGKTLKEIFKNYFPTEELQQQIIQELETFERQMSFEYIAGAFHFIHDLKQNGLKVAIVTSSDNLKMEKVFQSRPELPAIFDIIITADKIKRSKPDPEGYLLAAQELNLTPQQCVVFEDSFMGLEAGRRAGMKVVGLATTNPEHTIVDKADAVIPDFKDFTCCTLESLI